jgi:predicted metallopeptidase
MPDVACRPPRGGFDFTMQMRSLCSDIAARTPELAHIDLNYVAIACAQTRSNSSYGLQASLTPLRFERGARTGMRNGRVYTVEPVFDEDGTEMLYILTFYLPRFMDLVLREKLVTVFHELWHVSPEFDGDLRRHEGRCFVHSRSQQEYDAGMERLVERWLRLSPPKSLTGFLDQDFAQLQRRYGGIYGLRFRRPRLLPAG